MATINVIGRVAGKAASRSPHPKGECKVSLSVCGASEESVRDVQQLVQKTKTGSASYLTRKAKRCSSIDFLPLLPRRRLQRLNPLKRLQAQTG